MARKCDCSSFGTPHRDMAVKPLVGRYVRLKFNGRWMWAIRKPGTRMLKGTPIATWVEVTDEGDLPGEGTKKSPEKTNFLIGHPEDVVEKPASMCLHYGLLTTLEP